MTYLPDQQPRTVQPHHFDSVDSVLTSPVGVNHLGFNNDDAQWLHLRPSGPHGRITAGEAVMLRPADIDVIITISWGGRGRTPAILAFSNCLTRSAPPRRRC
jgi:hypothetical protein